MEGSQTGGKLRNMPRSPFHSSASFTASAAADLPDGWSVYLLECEDGSLYAGVALDVEARFISHALGLGAAYTRSHLPLRVLACRRYPSKGDALRAEYALKQWPRHRKLDFFEPAEKLPDAQLPALRKASATVDQVVHSRG